MQNVEDILDKSRQSLFMVGSVWTVIKLSLRSWLGEEEREREIGREKCIQNLSMPVS